MIRIGIIEDNIFLLKSFRDYLNETDGMSVVFASVSMEDAKEQMENKSIPAPDVVLLDIFLPGESGIDAIPYIKEKFPDTKIIVLTAYNEENLIINCLKQGAVGYALKTSKLSQLVDIILHTNRTGAFVDELSLSKIIANLQSKKTGSVKELLTFREKEIVGLVEKGLSYKQMSEMLL